MRDIASYHCCHEQFGLPHLHAQPCTDKQGQKAARARACQVTRSGVIKIILKVAAKYGTPPA